MSTNYDAYLAKLGDIVLQDYSDRTQGVGTEELRDAKVGVLQEDLEITDEQALQAMDEAVASALLASTQGL